MWLAGIALCGQVQQMMALVRGSCGAAGETDLAHEALAKPLAAADGATMSAAVADGDGPMADEPAVADVQPSLCAAGARGALSVSSGLGSIGIVCLRPSRAAGAVARRAALPAELGMAQLVRRESVMRSARVRNGRACAGCCCPFHDS